VRPTRQCLVLFAGGFILAAAPLWVGSGLWVLWVAFFASIVVLCGIDWILMANDSNVRLHVSAPEQIPIGESSVLDIVLAPSHRALHRLEILPELSAGLHESSTARATRSEDGYNASFDLKPLQRGRVSIDAVWTKHRGPLGLMESQHRHPVEQFVDVTPNTPAVRAIALRFESDPSLRAGLQVEKFKGEGTEFDSLREFVKGDDRRAVDWKASARHAKLLCRQFRAETNHQLIIAVDSGRLMNEPIDGVTRLDHAINSSLLLSYVGLRTGALVGFFSFGARPGALLAPRSGVATHQEITRASAAVEYSRDETNYTLGLMTLAHRIRRRSLIVFLTDFSDTITAELMVGNLNRLARRHLVVFVTLRDTTIESVASDYPADSVTLHRSMVAQRVEEDRAVVFGRLRRMGLLTIDTRPELVGSRLINEYLDVRRRDRI